MSDEQTTLHIAVIGPPGAGKTAYLERLIRGEFITEHVATKQPSARELNLRYTSSNTSSRYDVTFVCHEMHHLQHSGTPFHGVIVLMDPASPTLEGEIIQYLHEIETSNAFVFSRPCVCFCATKFDLKANEERSVQMLDTIKQRMRTFCKPHADARNYVFYPISAKSNYNFETPWTSLLRMLTGIPTLYVTDTVVQGENVYRPPPARPARRLLVSEDAVPVSMKAVTRTRAFEALIVGPPKAGATAYLNRLRGIDLDAPTKPGLYTHEFDMYASHADGTHERICINISDRNGVSLHDTAMKLRPNLIIILIDPQSPNAVLNLTEFVTWAYRLQSACYGMVNPRIAVCLSCSDIIVPPGSERALMERLDMITVPPHIGRFVVSALRYDSLLMPLLYGARSSPEASDVQIGRPV